MGLDAINLVESGLDRLCACTVAVLAPAEDRVRRIMARDGISRDYARLRISAQPSDGFYREHCSHILENTCAGPAQFRDPGTDFLPENTPGNRTYLRRNQNHDRRNEGQARKAVLQPQKRL